MANAATPTRPRARTRYRRRLRSRIILGFVLLGFGLTLLLAFATIKVRDRVEDQLVTDVMNRNIYEYARRFFASPGSNPELPVQQMVGRVVVPAKFEQLRGEQPDWYALGDGIHMVHGQGDDHRKFSYRLAVRKRRQQRWRGLDISPPPGANRPWDGLTAAAHEASNTTKIKG